MAKRKAKTVKRGGKSKAAGMVGRRTSFNEITMEIIGLLAKRGFTDAEMAQCLKITERTFNNWKNKHPQFFQTLNDWKYIADNKVERSLYERACGYNHPETKAQYVQGSGWETLDMIKHYPPDPTSMIFWLKNRKTREWRDRVDHDFGKTGDALANLLDSIASQGPPKPAGDENG